MENINIEPLLFALSNLYGLKEINGSKDNPLILKMFSEIGHSWVKHDETAWCSAAHNWIHKKLGFQYTKSLSARSWLNLGTEIEKPVLGCTVVLWRVSPSSGYGHVGFFIKETDSYIYILGGNQSNQYKISKYPKNNLLSYRIIPKEDEKVKKSNCK